MCLAKAVFAPSQVSKDPVPEPLPIAGNEAQPREVVSEDEDNGNDVKVLIEATDFDIPEKIKPLPEIPNAEQRKRTEAVARYMIQSNERFIRCNVIFGLSVGLLFLILYLTCAP